MFTTCGEDIKLHCIEKNQLESSQIFIPQNKDEIVHASWSQDKKYIVFVDTSGVAQIFSMDQMGILCKIEIENVLFARFRKSTKRFIALTTTGGYVSIYDTRKRIVCKVLDIAGTDIPQLDWTSNDQQFCGYAEDFLLIFDLGELKRIQQPGRCTALRCHPQLNQVVVGCENGFLIAWDTMTCQNIFEIHVLETAISEILVIEDYFILSSENMLKLCREYTESGKFEIQDISFETCAITCMDFCPKDRLLAIGLADGYIKIFNHSDDNMLLTFLKVHESAVNKVSFPNKETVNKDVPIHSTPIQSVTSASEGTELASVTSASVEVVDYANASEVEVEDKIEEVKDDVLPRGIVKWQRYPEPAEVEVEETIEEKVEEKNDEVPSSVVELKHNTKDAVVEVEDKIEEVEDDVLPRGIVKWQKYMEPAEVEVEETIEEKVEEEKDDEIPSDITELKKYILDGIKKRHLMSCERDIQRTNNLFSQQMLELEAGFKAEVERFVGVCEGHKSRFMKKWEEKMAEDRKNN